MSKETTAKFALDIGGRLDYFREEFEMTYAEAIGVLDIVKHKLLEEVEEEEEEDG